MRIFHFSEQAYPDAWNPEYESLRVNLPNRLCDPQIAGDLFHRHLDEWQLCDELGLHIMVNEHHATATCISSSCTLTLATLARITKNARLLALGIPLANRNDPVRVAEEAALIDVLSRGRFEMGFVKGIPYEISPANSNPVGMMDRFWESHDLILKALSTHDGPFSFEGRYFHSRSVNIWPRPVQDPHPPVWVPTMSASGVRPIAERGHVAATFLTGYSTKNIYDEYRKVFAEAGRGEAGIDRLAYVGLCAVADTRAEAIAKADKVADYLRTTAIVAEAFSYPSGYFPPQAIAQILRKPVGRSKYHAQTLDGRTVEMTTASVEALIEAGVMFAGTPDDVYKQIINFTDAIGGVGNLILMMQAGHLSHADTVSTLKLFAKEVMPRLQQERPYSVGAAA
jgi:alkanesulfonate monooxygenase SsuD/methylene tetrahydromethanopterin reductase-like flavin-dependent oxidoreductase (luciferase family)